MSEHRDDGIPKLELRDPAADVERTLSAIRDLAVSHPDAAAAVFSSLVAEGRAFARTPSGRRWRARLSESALLRRAAVLFDTTTLWLLAEGDDRTPASAYLDALFLAAESNHGETWTATGLARGERK